MPYKIKFEYTDPRTLKVKSRTDRQTHRKNAMKLAYDWLLSLGDYNKMINGQVFLRKAEDNSPAGSVYAKKMGGRIFIVYGHKDSYYTVNPDGTIQKVA